MLRCLAFGLVSSLLLAASTGVASAEVLNKEQILGHWKVVYMERNGSSRPDLAKQIRMEIYPHSMKLIQESRPATDVSYFVDQRFNPGTFSWSQHGWRSIITQLGIYQLDGDVLTICLGAVGGPAPSSFQAKVAFGQTLYVLTRQQIGPAVDVPETTNWLSLGVFSLALDEEGRSQALLNLSTDPEGNLTGKLFYLETQKRLSLSGKIDRTTGQVRVNVAGGDGATLDFDLDALTEPSGQVKVNFKDRPAQTWTMTPVFAPSRGKGIPAGEAID